MLRSPQLVIGHVLAVDVIGISSENDGRNTKTPAVIAGAPFPFPRLRAFLPLPSPSPFCGCHAGYPSEQKTTLRPTNIMSLSRRKFSLLF